MTPVPSIPGKEKPGPLASLPGNQPTPPAPGDMGPALDSISQSLQAAGITSPADLEAQLNQLQQGIEMLAVASRQVADGVALLVDQTKTTRCRSRPGIVIPAVDEEQCHHPVDGRLLHPARRS